jgi:PAS domain S-box-containing protein
MVFWEDLPLTPADEVVLFRSMFRQAGTALLLLDPTTGRIVGANPAAVRFYGYPAHVLAGMSISQINILPPEILRQRMEEAQQRRRSFFHFRHRLSGGELRDVEVYSGPVVVRGRTFLYSIIHDITEEVRLRRERESLAQRLRLAMEVGRVAVWEINDAGEFFLTSPANGLGPCPQGEGPVSLEQVAEMFVPEHGQRWMAAVRDCFLHGVPVDLELCTHQGRWVRCAGRRTEAGENTQVVGVAHDITPIKAQEEAERQGRLAAENTAQGREEFMRFLGHEIRTPLAGVVGLARLAASQAQGTVAQYLEQIQRTGESLLGLLGDVLDVCRLQVGKMPMVEELFSPASLCQGVALLFQPQAQAKGLRVQVELWGVAGVQVWGPKARVEQILSNLLSNAVKFTERGEVGVSCCLEHGVEGPRLRLEVWDTGCGIPEDLRPHLFDAFTQGVVEARRIRGTGLGLAIVRGLVQQMGGSLDVESTVGEGTRFRVVVPVRPAAAEEIPVRCDADVPRGGGDVLVAEDDPVNQAVVRALLERLGYVVTVVGDGEAAVAAVAAQPFAIAFLDVSMPLLDGLEAARRIRQLRPTLPVVVVSAYDANDAQIPGVVDAVLTKPISLEELQSVVSRLVGHGQHLS